MSNIMTIGCDPEVFIFNTDTRKFVTACEKIGGTKKEPKQFDGLDKGYTYQEDGVTLELGVPPSDSNAAWMRSLDIVWRAAERLVKNKMGDEYTIKAVPHAKFASGELKKYPQASQIGCEEDFSAYPEQERETPKITDFGLTRFAGGHVHIGYDKSIIPPNILVRMLDAELAASAMYHIDRQGPRRKFYGVPGLYREKPYGVEYRTLSNRWFDPEYRADYASTIFEVAYTILVNASTDPERLSQNYFRYDWEAVRTTVMRDGDRNFAAFPYGSFAYHGNR